MLPTYEVADILQRNISTLEHVVQNSWKRRTLYALSVCRTKAMGGHIDVCSNPKCRKIHVSYNSCRNRHCPKCQGNKREEWIQARESELFNAPYYHVVFTLPSEFNSFCLSSPKEVYNILFKTVWNVIKVFAENPKFLGAKTGMIAIVHTWGQNLSFHPHLHCIIPGGGINKSHKWKTIKGKNKYLFPVKAMSNVFRAKFIENFRKEFSVDQQVSKKLFAKPWVVYCKQPFWGPKQVIEYLGRYTHKIAISNHRIKCIENSAVTFTAKDYRKGGAKHLITLSDHEFIRRFSLHILPKGFTRIRHYGILSSTLKKQIVPILQEQLGRIHNKEKHILKHLTCFKCGIGQLITIVKFDARGPPLKNDDILKLIVQSTITC